MKKEVKKKDDTDKKKTVLRHPISNELSRTKEYEKELSKIYFKYINLSYNASYKGPNIKLTYICSLCQGITQVRAATMLKGSGCKVCRTNSSQIKDLVDHHRELDQKKRYRLVFDPVMFNRKLKYYYKCIECNSQIYMRPADALQHSCEVCKLAKERRYELKMYQNRLDVLYGKDIQRIGLFSMTHPILHSCKSNTHKNVVPTWFAYATDMFQGRGCPKCKPIEVKKLKPVKVRGRTFTVRNKLERKALKQLHRQAGKMSEVFTALEYLIPVTFGKHVPAFYIQKTNTVIDVAHKEKILTKESKFRLSEERVNKLGFNYRIMAEHEGQFSLLSISQIDFKRTKRQKKLAKANMERKEVQVVKKANRQNKLFEIKKKRLAHIFKDEKETLRYFTVLTAQSEAGDPTSQKELELMKSLNPLLSETGPPFGKS